MPFRQRSDVSQFWQSVIHLLPVLRIGSSISIGFGFATLFWLDRWASEWTFAVRFPVLFSIAVEPRTSVEVALLDLRRLLFWHPFRPPELAAWDEMLECIALHSPDVNIVVDRISCNAPDMFAEIQSVPLSAQDIRWLTIGMLTWTLWTIRNKLVIERVPLRRASDAVFKMCGFLQLWRPLSLSSDKDAINNIIANIHLMALCMALPLPPPPPEPD
ncbi:putative TdLSC37 protein [Hordeum vulgare]|nr:putative TdLSC37 protein [Hordeum vulgare]